MGPFPLLARARESADVKASDADECDGSTQDPAPSADGVTYREWLGPEAETWHA